MAGERALSIHMACNDPDNGDFTGRVCQIALDDSMLDLTAKAWMITSMRRCPRLVDHGSYFALSGKRWPFLRYHSWAGNWCWDAYVVKADIATQFLVWLHKRGLFQCEGGWVELCEAWDRPAPLVLPDKWWTAPELTAADGRRERG